jgi:hypothetical protein
MAKNNTTKQLSGGCLALFGLPFLCAGLFLTGLYFHGYLKWWQARSWEETPCWIESAELKHSDESSRATATYRYEYAGRAYHGDKVSFHGGSDNIGSFQSKAHREISRHAPGKSAKAERESGTNGRKPFRCYVNPAKPDEAVLYRTLRWEMQAFMAIFALTFPAVGAGLVAGSLLGMRTLRREAALRDLRPAEPWRWKAAWADATIPESANVWKQALYFYTLWSGLIIVPLVVTTAMSGAFQRVSSAWLLMIFVALWMIPLWFSIKRLRHRIAAGTVRFEPKEWPASPGGVLRGVILLAKPLPLRGNTEVTLSCEKSITRGSGEDRTTTTEKIWSHSEAVAQETILRDLSGFRLPVSFALPADAPESGGEEETKHLWKLELKVPGTAIHSVFEVPVFRTAKSPLAEKPSPQAPSIFDEASADLPALLSARRIRAEFDPAGFPLSIVCPPARHLSLIVFLIIFDLIWTGAAVFLIQQHAPLIFRIVWPVSAAVIWLIVLWNLLHKRSVTIDSTSIQVRNQLGPVIWTQSFEKSQITGFSHDTNMTSNNTSFYRVRLESVLGKKTTLADGITESTTAAALVKRLEAWKK